MHGQTIFRLAPCVALLLTLAAHSAPRAEAGDLLDAQSQVRRAAQVVSQMIRDGRLYGLLLQARGVFIVPQSPGDADAAGSHGREGVLLAHGQGEWSSPAFYDIGILNTSGHTGTVSESLVLILMSDKALNAFKRPRQRASLSGHAGLSIMRYDANSDDSADNSDMIVWSSSNTLASEAAAGLSNVRQDETENEAYYMQGVTLRQILSGSVQNPHAWALRATLPTRIAAN